MLYIFVSPYLFLDSVSEKGKFTLRVRSAVLCGACRVSTVSTF